MLKKENTKVYQRENFPNYGTRYFTHSRVRVTAFVTMVTIHP